MGWWCFCLSRAAKAVLNLPWLVDRKAVSHLSTIFNSKCVPIACYDTGVWGYSICYPLQDEENHICRRLLSQSPARSNLIFQNELGLLYLEDGIKLDPILQWSSVWANPAASLNREVISNCLQCDRGSTKHWIVYIGGVLNDLGRPSCLTLLSWFAPQTVRWWKSLFFCKKTTFKGRVWTMKVYSLQLLSSEAKCGYGTVSDLEKWEMGKVTSLLF